MLDPFVDGRGGIRLAGGQRARLRAGCSRRACRPRSRSPMRACSRRRRSSSGSSSAGPRGAPASAAANTTDGDPVIGSSNVAASTYGFAGGMDYHVSPDTVLGFALAGGGTNWGLAQGFGGGRSDAFQAGVYGTTHVGPAYVGRRAGLQPTTGSRPTAPRSATSSTASFEGQGYGARLEAGYRFAVRPRGSPASTPYAAVQAQYFHTPAYGETDLTGGGFGLNYAAMSGTDTRSELGARFDDLDPARRHAACCCARGWPGRTTGSSNPALDAAFQTLPGAASSSTARRSPKTPRSPLPARSCGPPPPGHSSPSSTASSPPARGLTPAPPRCAIRGDQRRGKAARLVPGAAQLFFSGALQTRDRSRTPAGGTIPALRSSAARCAASGKSPEASSNQ